MILYEEAELDSYRRAVVRRAERRIDELVAAVHAAVIAELPEYGAGRSRHELEDIRSGLRHSIGLCLSIVGERRSLRADEVVGLRLLGGQRAREGISKPSMAAAVRVATRMGRVFLMTCGEDVEADPGVLLATYREITALLDRFEDEAMTALEAGHDETYRCARAIGDRAEAILVDRLLERRFDGSEDILPHAAKVGLLSSRQARVVVIVGDDKAALGAAAARLQSQMRVAVGPMRFTHVPHLPVVAQPTIGDEELVAALEATARETGTVVVHADRSAPLTALWSTYHAMRESLPYVRVATNRPGALSALVSRCQRIVFTGTDAEREELVEDVLGPFRELSSRESAELLEVLEALYETGGSATALARHLHLHKNTVANRLRRVQEVTGLDTRRPKDLLVLETVLCMQRVVRVDLRPGRPAAWPAERTA